MAPINLIIFDIFDTLINPSQPPYIQYAEEARKFGLDVKDETVKNCFKDSFKRLAKQYPIYGLNTGLQSSDDWWRLLISETIKESGIEEERLKEVLDPLGTSLLNRFASSKAYSLAEGVKETLQNLNNLKKEKNSSLNLTVASNSDDRILHACKDLGLQEYLNLEIVYDPKRMATNIPDDNKHQTEFQNNHRIPVSGPTLSYDIGFEKPDKHFFHLAVQRMFSNLDKDSQDFKQICNQTLYVGDQFGEDFMGASNAGLQAIWLNRDQKELTKQQLSQLNESKHNLHQVHSILDIVEIVKQSWM